MPGTLQSSVSPCRSVTAAEIAHYQEYWLTGYDWRRCETCLQSNTCVTLFRVREFSSTPSR